MQVGVTKNQGLYNKPSAAVHPGAIAAGTLPQYNTLRSLYNSTDEPAYNDIGLYETSSIASHMLWHEFIRHC